jgi:hypothetical protein
VTFRTVRSESAGLTRQATGMRSQAPSPSDALQGRPLPPGTARPPQRDSPAPRQSRGPGLKGTPLLSETIAGLGVCLSPGRSESARFRPRLWSTTVVSPGPRQLGRDRLLAKHGQSVQHVYGLARSALVVRLSTAMSRPVGVGCGCHRGPLTTTWSAGKSAPEIPTPGMRRIGAKMIRGPVMAGEVVN